MCPPVGPPDVTAARCHGRHVSPCRPARCYSCHVSTHQVSRTLRVPMLACQVSRSSSVPCRPARCHGCHVSIPGVTDAMCALSANHVSRPLCVPLSVCQVSRLPCVVPPGVKAALCRSTKYQERHVSVRKVSRAHVSAVRQPSHISVLTHHISTPAAAVSLPTDSNPRLPAL
jgi:hypothetical protein